MVAVPLQVLKDLAHKTPSKILLVVCDGLGGLPDPATGLTELETARTPNLDQLASASTLGVATPVASGISPGSGPGHLAIFGYDPIEHLVGRGVLSALGVGFPLEPGDVAARMNFCTLDEEGRIVDRRAGRISTDRARPLVERLRKIHLPGVEIFVHVEMDYRGVLILRGEGLDERIADTDPQVTGVPPYPARPLEPAAERTAAIVNRFIAQARELLAGERPANGILLRGFSRLPKLPSLRELYQLDAAAIAVYPMYRGLARLVGMEIVPTGRTPRDEVRTLREVWDRFDYFFVHFKPLDTAGEDGDFARKVRAIEEIDELIPDLLALRPDVLVLTGDHSTPSVLAAHSWHPVPFLLHSRWIIPDRAERFTERTAQQGGLGHFAMREAMGLILANAEKLIKYGA